MPAYPTELQWFSPGETGGGLLAIAWQSLILGPSFTIPKKSELLLSWPKSVQEFCQLQPLKSSWLLSSQDDCSGHFWEVVMTSRKLGKHNLLCLSQLFPWVCFPPAGFCSWSRLLTWTQCVRFQLNFFQWRDHILKLGSAKKNSCRRPSIPWF